MNDNKLANDFLNALTIKAGFNTQFRPSQGSPTGNTKELILDKYDLASCLANPVLKSLITFISRRMATKYEYEKIKKLLEKSRTADVPSILERKAMESKHEKIVAENSKLKEEIKLYQKKVLEAQLAYAASKDKEAKVCKEINSEVMKITLVQVAANKIKGWAKWVITSDTKRFLSETLPPQTSPKQSPKNVNKVAPIAEVVEMGKEIKLQVASKAKDSIEIKFDVKEVEEALDRHYLSETPLSNITQAIAKEIAIDADTELFPAQNAKNALSSELKPKIARELSTQRKAILDSIIRIKTVSGELREREERLKTELCKKCSDADDKVKDYLLHVQNQEVIKYLMEYRKTLGASKASLITPHVLPYQPNLPLTERLKKSLNTLQKLLVLVNYAEGNKYRTDKFLQAQIVPLKGIINEFSVLITTRVKELMIEVQTAKNVQYLQRKLYMQTNPELFTTDRSKDLFLNTSFFNARFKNLNIRRLLTEGGLVIRGTSELLADVSDFAKIVCKEQILREITDKDKEGNKWVENAQKTAHELKEFRENCATELMGNVSKLIRKADHTLSKKEKLENLIRLFVVQPAQKLIEFRRNEKNGMTIRDYRAEWKRLIGKKDLAQ